jgi:hypothetical protein
LIAIFLFKITAKFAFVFSSEICIYISTEVLKMTAFWDVATCSLTELDRHSRGAYCLYHQTDYMALMMEAVRTSETSVYFYEITRHCIPEGCHLHTHRHENFKCHSERLKYI